MNAITINNQIFEVKEVRGSFVFYINEKQQVKCINGSQVTIIEVSEVSKTKKQSSKKLNPANFMSQEQYAKSRYATMSDSDFEAERKQDAMNTISW